MLLEGCRKIHVLWALSLLVVLVFLINLLSFEKSETQELSFAVREEEDLLHEAWSSLPLYIRLVEDDAALEVTPLPSQSSSKSSSAEASPSPSRTPIASPIVQSWRPRNNERPSAREDEERYARLRDNTARDLAALAPGLDMPVDACPGGAPCLMGDIVLLHQGRCGSHALMEPLGLNQSADEEDVFPWGFSDWAEGFNFHAGFSWTPYAGNDQEGMLLDMLEQLTARLDEVRPPGKHYFLSLKLGQISKIGRSTHDFLTVLAAYGFRHLVVIYRNPLRVRASYLAASVLKANGTANAFHEREKENSNCLPVTMSWKKVKGDFEETEVGYQQALEHPAFRNPIALEYVQDLYEDPYYAAERVLAGLGVYVPPRRMELLRTTDCPMEELVTNWPQVVRLVTGTPYEWTLEKNGVQEPPPLPIENLLRMCPIEPLDFRPSYVRCARTAPVHWDRKGWRHWDEEQ